MGDLLVGVVRLAEVAVVAVVVVDDLGEVAADAGEALVEGCWKEEWGRKAWKKYWRDWKVWRVEGDPTGEVEEVVEMVWMVVLVGSMRGVKEVEVRRLCR